MRTIHRHKLVAIERNSKWFFVKAQGEAGESLFDVRKRQTGWFIISPDRPADGPYKTPYHAFDVISDWFRG